MTTRKSAVIPSDHVVPVLRLLRRALRFWWAGLLVLALVLGATAAAIVLLPKKYKSEAAVLYREGLQWGANEPLGARRVGPRLRELLLSRSQLGKVVEEMGLFPALVAAGDTPEAVEEMRLATTFRYDQSDVFVISYTGSSPEEAQRVTARLTELLIAENARLRSEQAEVQREFLENEKNRKAEELAAKEAEQLRFLARHPEFAHEQTPTMGVTLRARSPRGPSAAAALTGRRDTALAALRREEERLRRQISSPGEVAAAPADPAVLAEKAEAQAAMVAAQRELAERRAQFTEQHPDVRRAFALAADAEERHRRATRALEEAQAPVPVAVLRERLAAVQDEIAAQQRERAPQAAAGDVERSDAAKRIVAVETEWARLNREVAEARERLQALDTQQFMASMTATMLTEGQAAQLVVIEPAYRPARPVGASSKKLALFGAAGAIGLAMLLALALAAVDDLFYDGDDVERLNLAPVLAEVPRRWLPGRSRRRRRADEDAAAAASAPADAGAPGNVREVRRIPRGLTRVAMRPALGPDTSGPRAAPETARPPSVPLHPVEALALRKGEASVPMVSEPGDDALSSTAFFARPGDSSEDLVRIHRLQTSGRVDPRVLMLGAPDDPAAAAFRVLRHRLRERRGARVLLVTSPRAGEGKTSTAVNLALALGEEGGARVLLVEANFRRPALAGVLGFQPPVCLGQQFELHRTRPTAPWVVVETVPPWLHTATVAPDAASRGALDGRALALFIEDMREAGYEYIVVDGPAILDGADANLIEERVDGILLTVWARRSRARRFRAAVDQIGAGKLLGVVVLGT